MSTKQLPVHVACYGVSSDAIAAARYQGHPSLSGPTWSQQLAAARQQFDSSAAVTAKAAQQARAAIAQATANPTSLAPPPSLHVHRAHASDLASQPVCSQQYLNYISAAQAKVPQLRPKAACTSVHLDSSKLVFTGIVNLQHTDFAAVADSSIGGSGLPRPYGRFTAGRNGDGTATWERLPPARGTWRVKPHAASAPASPHGMMTSDVVQKKTESQAASTSHADASNGQAMDKISPRSESSSPHWDVKHRTEALASRSRHHTKAQTTLASSPTYRRPDTTDPSWASGNHGTAASEHSSSSAWFQLPAATFLTEVPTLPAHIRVDCGYSSAKEFLRSGLHQKPNTTGTGSTSSPLLPPGSSTAAGASFPQPEQGQQSPADADMAVSSPSSQQTLHTGGIGSAVGTSQTTSSMMSSTTPGHRPVIMESFAPIDCKTEALVKSTIEQVGYGLPSTHELLAAIQESQKPAPKKGVMPNLATAQRVTHLPREASLPRRCVPAVGK